MTLTALLLGVAFATSASLPATTPDSATDALRADIVASADTLRLRDPELAAGRPREAFDSAIAAVLSMPETTPRHRIIVAWAEAIALLHDGHTQLGLARDAKIAFHQFPIRVYWFDDGLFVTATADGNDRLLGARLNRIDGMTIGSVIRRVRPVIHADNETAIRGVLPSRITLAEVLEATGVSHSTERAEFTLTLANGRVESVTLSGTPVGAPRSWTLARDRLRSRPLYLTRVGTPYWFTYIDSARTMYAQYNSVENDTTNNFDGFCARLFHAVDSLPVDRLVLDIRNNNGGDNTLLRPLELGLIKSAKVNRPGHLYVILGRLTFSAAVNLAADLEKWTEAIFVGEPTSAGANHFGETIPLFLPRTGILLLYSSRYYESVGDPKDSRDAISPKLPVPVLSTDYFSGRDAALAAAMAAPSGRTR